MSNRREEHLEMLVEIRGFKRELYEAALANDSAKLWEVWYGSEGGREAYLLTAAMKAPKIRAAIHEAAYALQEKKE